MTKAKNRYNKLLSNRSSQERKIQSLQRELRRDLTKRQRSSKEDQLEKAKKVLQSIQYQIDNFKE